ncbi:Muskelin 1, intracellular mediator containing kelch motif, partial [Ceratobasidium sp. 370]
VDRPEDANSRWTTERHPNPEVKESHWVMLRLDQMSVVLTITFGKFKQSHPCNISSFRVFGGLGTKDHEMRELLSAKLSDDGIPQTFSLNHTTPNSGVMFPCRYIKICPTSAHGKSYNMSIWHIALAGILNPSFVKEVHNKFVAHKNNQALYLILKHLRQNNFLAAHSALLAQTHIRPEHPRVTELHDALVLNGDVAKAEELVERMVREDKLFDHCARVSPPACAWKRVTPDGPVPPGRGGHQLCIDVDNRTIYLFGGWDGSKNLADFWSYSVVDGRWTMLSEDTCADGGPSARSCHNMVFCSTNGNIYVLAQILYDLKDCQTGLTFIRVPDTECNSKYLPDMHSFTPATRTSQRLAFDPAIANAASAPRALIRATDAHRLIWQNSERDRDRARVPNAEPATFATYHITQKRWVRSEPRLGPFKNVSGGGDVWEGLELPRPRSAHQVVYDPLSKIFYMFGGNSGEDGIPRLNDLWSMRLVRPAVDELLRKALLAVRKFRFKRMCNTAPPFEALTYLQTKLAEIVDQADEDESADLRGMLSYLLARTTNGNSEMGGQQAEESERSERRELFDFLMQFVAPDQREPETELSDIIESV